MTTTAGLVANWIPASQRVATLTVNQAVNTSYSFTNQERIFFVDKSGDSYLPTFVKSAIAEIGATIEIDISRNAISGVINNNPLSPGYGTPNTTSGPYRFANDGVTVINSYQQLQQFVVNFRDTGMAEEIKVFLPQTKVPAIIGSSLSQFALRRNNETAMSWELGEFGGVNYYQSNLLPVQTAGTVGNSAQTLTLVSVNDASGQNVTAMTFSGATNNDVNAIKAGDLLSFNDGVSGQQNMRYLTRFGKNASDQKVQFRATANAAANGSGQVTINIAPALCWVAGPTQNINNPLNAGMQASALPNHRAGLIVGGDAFYVAMPKLPEERPYDSVSEYDPETGASLRLSYGSLLGQNQMGFIHSALWDSFLVPEYSMRIAFPL
jgi:hypothetical protein